MKTYQVTNIQYDTDGAKVKLPETLRISVPDNENSIEDFLCDKLSDITGFCHNGFSFSEWDHREFNVMHNVGTVKYLVNYHDGIKTHNDGSRFFDIACFSNKKKLKAFTDELLKSGYVGILVALFALVFTGCVYVPPAQNNNELQGLWSEAIQSKDQIYVSSDSIEFLRNGERTAKEAIVGDLLEDGVVIPSGCIYLNGEAKNSHWEHPRTGTLYVFMTDSIGRELSICFNRVK